MWHAPWEPTYPEVLHLAHPMLRDCPAMFASPDISDGKVEMILLSFRDEHYIYSMYWIFVIILRIFAAFHACSWNCTNICETNVLRLFSKRWKLCPAENSLLNGGASILWLDIYENPTTIGCYLGQGDPNDPWEVWRLCLLSPARCEECPWETKQNKCWGDALLMMDFGGKAKRLLRVSKKILLKQLPAKKHLTKYMCVSLINFSSGIKKQTHLVS